MRIFKYNVYITILSTAKTYMLFGTFEIYGFEMAVLHHRWNVKERMLLTGHIPVIHGLFVQVVICGCVRNNRKYVTRKRHVRDTVELVTNICHFSLSWLNIARHPVQLLLLVRLCILYVCISNDTTSSTRHGCGE